MSKHTMQLAARELPPIDPAQLTADVKFNGDTFRLCFDVQALMEAEEQLNEEGNDICLLYEMPRLHIKSVIITFAAAARKYQPWLTYEDAVELLSDHPKRVQSAGAAIIEAWNKSSAPKEPPVGGALDEENPPNPS